MCLPLERKILEGNEDVLASGKKDLLASRTDSCGQIIFPLEKMCLPLQGKMYIPTVGKKDVLAT